MYHFLKSLLNFFLAYALLVLLFNYILVTVVYVKRSLNEALQIGIVNVLTFIAISIVLSMVLLFLILNKLKTTKMAFFF